MRTPRHITLIHGPNLSRYATLFPGRERYAPRLKKKQASTFGQRTGHTQKNQKPNRTTINGNASLLAKRKWIAGANTTRAIKSRMNQNWIEMGYFTAIPNSAFI